MQCSTAGAWHAKRRSADLPARMRFLSQRLASQAQCKNLLRPLLVCCLHSLHDLLLLPLMIAKLLSHQLISSEPAREFHGFHHMSLAWQRAHRLFNCTSVEG